jgi:hypothetical protein
MPIKLDDNGSMPALDLENPDSFSQKPLSEQETRARLLGYARQGGFEKELLLLFAKYDKLLRLCPDEKEREDIKKLGVAEFYQLLYSAGRVYR